MKLEILAIGVHPDDAELGCGGVLALEAAKGTATGIVDLTAGELGTRGTVELRAEEASAAAEVLGLKARENLGFADGFFRNDEQHQRKLIAAIRKYQPRIVITNAPDDRHPDHGRAAELTYDACFLAGLRQIKTSANGTPQDPWRPEILLHYIQDRYLKPDIVIDITEVMETKMDSIKAHSSQFFDPESKEPETYISSRNFYDALYGRAQELGRSCQFRYAEGFLCRRILGVKQITDLV